MHRFFLVIMAMIPLAFAGIAATLHSPDLKSNPASQGRILDPDYIGTWIIDPDASRPGGPRILEVSVGQESDYLVRSTYANSFGGPPGKEYNFGVLGRDEALVVGAGLIAPRFHIDPETGTLVGPYRRYRLVETP